MLNNPAPAFSLQDTTATGHSLQAETVLLKGSDARCPKIDQARRPRGPRVVSPRGIQSHGAVALADRQKKQPVRLPDTKVPGCLIRYVQ